MFEIVFSRPTKFELFSWLIRKVQGTPYSHAAILVDGRLLYQSTRIGVHSTDFAEFEKTHVVWKKPIATKTTGLIGVNYALGWLDGCIGCEYSQAQFVGFIFPKLRPLVINKRARRICSEFAADFLQDCCGVKVQKSMATNDFVTPKDIWEALENENR